jgi:hypothetical protein
VLLTFILSFLILVSTIPIETANNLSSTLPINTHTTILKNFSLKNIFLISISFVSIALIILIYKRTKKVEIKNIQQQQEENITIIEEKEYDILDISHGTVTFVQDSISSVTSVHGRGPDKIKYEFDPITKHYSIKPPFGISMPFKLQFPSKKKFTLKSCKNFFIQDSIKIENVEIWLDDSCLFIPNALQLKGENNKLFIRGNEQFSHFCLINMYFMQKSAEEPKELITKYTFQDKNDKTKTVIFETNGVVTWKEKTDRLFISAKFDEQNLLSN